MKRFEVKIRELSGLTSNRRKKGFDAATSDRLVKEEQKRLWKNKSKEWQESYRALKIVHGCLVTFSKLKKTYDSLYSLQLVDLQDMLKKADQLLQKTEDPQFPEEQFETFAKAKKSSIDEAIREMKEASPQSIGEGDTFRYTELPEIPNCENKQELRDQTLCILKEVETLMKYKIYTYLFRFCKKYGDFPGRDTPPEEIRERFGEPMSTDFNDIKELLETYFNDTLVHQRGPEEISSSADSPPAWQIGSSYKTLKDLLGVLTEKLNENRSKFYTLRCGKPTLGFGKLKDYIYSAYTGVDHTVDAAFNNTGDEDPDHTDYSPFYNTGDEDPDHTVDAPFYNTGDEDPDDKAYRNKLDDLVSNWKDKCTRYEVDSEYTHFELNNDINSDPRFALNIEPEHVPDALDYILKNAGIITEVKCTNDFDIATERIDNVIVYFSDPGTNRAALEQRLLPLKKYTRDYHPPMMEPIDPEIQGIAYGEKNPETSFGRYRSNIIAEAVKRLWQKKEKKDFTFDELLAEVGKEFKHWGIDFKNPHLGLLEEG